MFKLLKTGILPLLLLIVLSFSVSANYFVDDLGNISKQTFIAWNTPTEASHRTINIEEKDDVFYISYVKNIAGYRQQMIAHSTDLENWTLTQMSTDASHKRPCQLYKDIDGDMVCINRLTAERWKYWIVEDDETEFDTTGYYWDESDNYNYSCNLNGIVTNIDGFIWIQCAETTINDTDFVSMARFKNDFEAGDYNLSLALVSSNCEEEHSWWEFWEWFDEPEIASACLRYENVSNGATTIDTIIVEEDGQPFFEIFQKADNGNTTDIVKVDIIGDSPEWTYWLDIKANTNGYLWNYLADDDDIYMFLMQSNSAGGQDENILYFHYDAGFENWTQIGNLPKNTSSRDEDTAMIEGDQYLWGIYKTKPDVSIRTFLRMFKIAKSNMSLVYDEKLTLENPTTTFSAMVVGNIYGYREATARSSNVMVGERLIFPYADGLAGVSGHEAQTTTDHPMSLYVYVEEVNDELEPEPEEVENVCTNDGDCIAKYGDGWECVLSAGSFICVESEAEVVDPDYAEGDFAFTFNAFLEDIGIISNASKFFMAIALLIIINVIIFAVFMATTHEVHPVLHASISILTLFMVSYMGLIPIWVVVLITIMIVGIGVMTGFRGGTA